jgi:hypothetical protein
VLRRPVEPATLSGHGPPSGFEPQLIEVSAPQVRRTIEMPPGLFREWTGAYGSWTVNSMWNRSPPRNLPFELNAVRTLVSGHGFHLSKAQHSLSKRSLQPVRLQGRIPTFALHMSAPDPKRTLRKQPGHNHDRAIRSICKAGNRGCRPAAP